MKSPLQPRMAEARRSPLATPINLQRPRTGVADERYDARMRQAIADRVMWPVQAKRTVDFGYGDLSAAARAPAPSPVPAFNFGKVPLQAKLTVGQPGDKLEEEADQVAEQVMRMPDPGTGDGVLQRKCEEEGNVQRKGEGAVAGMAAPPIVHDVLRSAGQPLNATARAFMDPRFGHDFSRVRVHVDEQAAASARAIDALAYTRGQDIVFAAGRYAPDSSDGRRLLAHELAHTVQQEAAGAAPVVARQDARVLAALTRVDPIAGVGNPTEALAILRTLDTDELITTLIQVDDAFQLDVLVQAIGLGDLTPVGAAIYVVRFTSPHGTPDSQFGIQAARGIAQLPQDQQDALIARVLQRRGSSATVQDVREGAEALSESESTLDAQGDEEVDDSSALSAATLLAGVAMGPWNPGGMPIPFYIGNSAHVAIAAAYAAVHGSDAAFYNFSPVSSILQAVRALGLTVNPVALTAAQLGLKPDIANITRTHLYEIKPSRLQSLGATEALLYQVAFVAAGVPMTLGPTSESGTSGTIPAPGGWYTFSSPQPGVITYQYRQPRRRRVRQPATSPATSLSLRQQIAAITGLSGAALTIYLIISEGSRIVFPPRNLIPVP